MLNELHQLLFEVRILLGDFWAIVSLIYYLIFFTCFWEQGRRKIQFTKLEINLQLFYWELAVWPWAKCLQFDKEAAFSQGWGFCNQPLGKSALIPLSCGSWKISGSLAWRISESFPIGLSDLTHWLLKTQQISRSKVKSCPYKAMLQIPLNISCQNPCHPYVS